MRRKDKATEKQLEWEERTVPSFSRRRPGQRNKNRKKGQGANKPNSSNSGRNSRQLQFKAVPKRAGKRSSYGNRQPRGRANRNSRRK